MDLPALSGSWRDRLAAVRPAGFYVPGIAVLAALLTVTVLLSVVPGRITSWSLTGTVQPMVEAGGLWQPVLGYVQFGMSRIYVPVLAVVVVLGGELAARWLPRFRVLTAVAAGVAAGAQPVVVSGCGCSDGSAATAITLLEQALRIGLL